MNTKQNQLSPVAIIGIGCIFAKSPDLKAFLHLLTRGVSGISNPPPTHQHLVEYFDPDPKKPDHIYCNRGGFMPCVDFDPTEFNIPPNVIEATDTSQLLGLVTAKRALEDAGYGEKGKSFDRARTSVILGVTGTQELVIPLGARLGHPLWKKALNESGVPDNQAEQVIRRIADGYVAWQENSFPGLLGNVVAGRIANRLDLGGTNCVVDAACASSMGAFHMALLELGAGRSDMVITGGADTINDAFMHMCFSKTRILSASGDIRPFSKDADGTLLGEGIGLLVLKRLEDAEKDRDRIYAVIKGLGSASDGKSQSIYAPRPEGQAQALRRAYQQAATDPAQVGLVEAHGTGTRVGDQVEFKALCDVFGEVSANGNRCALGSVKSNIGHTKAAAGSAGLIKAALSVYHKVLPPTLKAESIDPKLGVEHSPFYVNTQLRPWICPDHRKRKAGVSAFGFGGSNFHAVLEEHCPSKQEPSWDGTVEIAAFSGPDKQAVRTQIEQWSKQAAQNPGRYTIGKLARQSRNRFRSTDSQRLVMVLGLDDSRENISRSCGQALQQLDEKGASCDGTVFLGHGPCNGKLAFLFPGQGSQYVGMGRDLICCLPECLEAFQDAAASLKTEVALDEYVYPRLPADSKHHDQRLRQTHIAQPAIGAVSVAMLRALDHFGLVPDATCGHSFGELAALHAAGWLAQKDLWRLAADRGSLMAAAGQNADEAGSMIAVKAPLDEIERLIRSLDCQDQIVLANKNSPDQGVLSGTMAAIEAANQACKAKGWSTVQLPVAAAFHSHLVASAQKPFETIVQSVQFVPGAISVMSNTLGGAYPTDIETVQATLGRQLACPVDFLSNVQTLYQQGIRTFVEVGPKNVLTDLVNSTLQGKDAQAIAVDRSKGRNSGIFDLACALAHLAALGFDVRLNRWEKPQPRPRKARMAIALSGANCRNAQPDKNKDERRLKTNIPEKQFAKVMSDQFQESKATAKPLNTPVAINQSMTPITKQKMDDNTKTTLQSALTAAQQGLNALQALQNQTAQAHQKFLETQAEASRTLQLMIQSTQKLATATAGGMTTHPETTQPAIPSIKPQPMETVAVPQPAQLGPEIKPPQSGPEQTAGVELPGTSIHPGRQGTHSDIEICLLSVVSQLTGYPAEMLGLEMDIESDLGIDSIKRVEILSALEERMPELPQVTPDMMGTLKTLGQICDYLSCSEGINDTAGAFEDNHPTQAPVSSDSLQIQDQLIEIVSQLTGYPAEMLGLEMDIESDLGIDSIKRVEILSALEEKMPDLPKVTPDMMGSLKSLGQISDFLSSAPDHPVSMHADDSANMPDAEPANSKNEQTHQALIAIVSQLTGYPVEMLGLEMDIESDLGIDSIKRVEILSALEEKMPDLPKVTPDMMGTLKTLGQIIAYLNPSGPDSAACATLPGPVSETESPPAAGDSVDSAQSHIDRQVIQLQSLPNPVATSLSLPANHFIGVAGALDGIGAELIKTLNSRGMAARSLSAPDQLTTDAPLAGLVLLAPVDAQQAFRWAQVCAPVLNATAEKANAWFITISALDGSFGFKGGPIVDPTQGALAGLAKTASIEWPRVRCLALDIDPAWQDFPAIARTLADEISMAHDHQETEIGLSPQRRITLRLSSVSVLEKDKIKLNAGDVVVITGGARGVTAEAAKALAARTECTLVLMGRSPHPQPEPAWLNSLDDEGQIKKAILTHQNSGLAPSPKDIEKQYRYWSVNRQIQNTLDALKRLGASAYYFPVDVNDASAVLDVVSRIGRELGPIKAFIHGAGVLEDRLIVDKHLDQFNKVYNTKVNGLLNFLDVLSDEALTYLVLFSSVSARIGNQGQVDYAMANEVLNKIARQQSHLRPQCKVLAINWGPWDGGMVTPALKRSFLKNNIALIPPDEGASALLAEMANHSSQDVEVVIGGLLNRPSSKKLPAQPANQACPAPADLFLTCKRVVDVAHHPVLQSHLLDGRPVVPLALIAEWLAHSALHANPGLTLHGMDNLRLFNGITLDSQKRIIQMLAGKAARKGQTFEVDVEIRDDACDGACRVHSRAKAILTDRLPAAPPFEENGHFKTNGHPPSINDFYGRVLFHGRDLHGIREIIRICEEGISARLTSAPAPIKWMKEPLRTRWIADPLILDCAFQMAIIWCHEQLGQVSLPSFAATYRQYCDRFPREGIVAVLEVRTSNERKLIGDFTFLDKSKQVIAHLKGYEAIMAPGLLKAFKAA